MKTKSLLVLGISLVCIGGTGILLVENQKNTADVVENTTDSGIEKVENKINIPSTSQTNVDENKQETVITTKENTETDEKSIGKESISVIPVVKASKINNRTKIEKNNTSTTYSLNDNVETFVNKNSVNETTKVVDANKIINLSPNMIDVEKLSPGININFDREKEETGTSQAEKPKEETGTSQAEKTKEETGTSQVEKPKEETGTSQAENPKEETENQPPQEITATGYTKWETITVNKGATMDEVRALLPQEVTLQLSNQTERKVAVEWKGYVNTWREGETTTVATYSLPDDVTGKKPTVTITLRVVAPKEAKLVLDKESYYYNENPRITVVDLDNKSGIIIQQNFDTRDKDLILGEHYTYDESTGVIELNTHAIFKRDNQKFTSETSLDMTIQVGSKKFPMKTINYNRSKTMYTLTQTIDDVRREGEIQVEVIGLEDADKTNVSVKVGEEVIVGATVRVEGGNDYVVLPYESIKSLASGVEHLDISVHAPGYGSFNVRLNFAAQPVETKNWTVEPIVSDNDGTAPTQEYGALAIYPYDGQSTIKLLAKDFTLSREELTSKLKVKIQSGNYDEFTVPTSGIGAWSIDRQTAGLRIKIPTDQSVGRIEYRRNRNGQEYPITTITLEVEGYETKIVRVCVLP